MVKAETRSFELECRADPDRRSPGILSGTLVPYGVATMVDGAKEVFESRSLTWDQDHGIAVFLEHDTAPRKPILIAHPRQEDTGAVISEPLPDSVVGRSIANRVKSGDLRGLSVEFHPRRETRSNGIRRIQEAILDGLAVTTSPIYSGAQVEVRSKRHICMIPPAPPSGGAR